MGGIGSGTWYRWDTKTTTEEVHRVDIRYMRKRGLLKCLGSSGILSWSQGGEKTGSIRFRLELNSLILMYKYRYHGEEWIEVEELVRLDRTPCNFGGERLWFLCPHCGKRVAVLYGARARFLCRHCHGLSYSSQCESDLDRMMRKARKIRRRLNASDDLSEEIWDKPKNMHWSTFNRLVKMECLVNEASSRLMLRRFAGLLI